MRDWSQNVKKRRERQMQWIKQGGIEKEWMPPNYESTDSVLWNQMHNQAKPRKKKRIRFISQLLVASILFMATLIVERHPEMRGWVQSIWTQEFAFGQVTEMYKNHLGEFPTVLPAFSKSTGESGTEWTSPLKGKIALSFDEKRKGVVIEAEQKGNMVAVKSGKVTYIGERNGIGHVVIIQHADGMESWYGLLEGISLQVDDEVKAGNPVGTVQSREGKFFAYLAIKEKDNQFIDPTEVITFE